MSKNIHFGIVYEKRANICHQSICKSILDPMCMSNPNIFITEAYKISMSTNTKQREWKAETYCLRDTRLTISLASGWYDNTDIAEVNHVRAHRNVSRPRFSVQTPPLIHQQWVHVLVGNPRVFRPQRDTSLLAEDGKLGVLAVWDALWQLYVVRLRQNFQTWFRSIRCRFRLLASRTGPALNQCKQETFSTWCDLQILFFYPNRPTVWPLLTLEPGVEVNLNQSTVRMKSLISYHVLLNGAFDMTWSKIELTAVSK